MAYILVQGSCQSLCKYLRGWYQSILGQKLSTRWSAYGGEEPYGWLMSPYLCAPLTYSTAYEISLGGLIASLGAERNSPIAIKKLHKYLLSDHKGFELKHSKCILARRRIFAASLILWESIWEAKWRKSGFKNVYSSKTVTSPGNIMRRKLT